jgi:hypothetical protein
MAFTNNPVTNIAPMQLGIVIRLKILKRTPALGHFLRECLLQKIFILSHLPRLRKAAIVLSPLHNALAQALELLDCGGEDVHQLTNDTIDSLIMLSNFFFS